MDNALEHDMECAKDPLRNERRPAKCTITGKRCPIQAKHWICAAALNQFDIQAKVVEAGGQVYRNVLRIGKMPLVCDR